YH
ncbi:hypothetical protein D044_0086B, partial [Vibrio parahaemolyticus EKP-026]